MDSLKQGFFCTYILLHLLLGVAIEPDFFPYAVNGTSGNYTSGSTYRRNLGSVLSSLPSDTKIDYGFYNLSAGQAPDQVNAIALCRGDISVEDCRGCVVNATRRILEDCPNQKEAYIYYEYCTLRYSNRSIFHVVETRAPYLLMNGNNATNVNEFTPKVETLLTRLQRIAAAGNSLKMFATGNETSAFYIIYGLVQCTPDLSEQQCVDCLAAVFGEIPEGGTRIGVCVLAPSCIYRYEVEQFFAPTPEAPPLPSPSTQSAPVATAPPPPQGNNNKTQTIIIIVISSFSAVILIFCICMFMRLRKLRKKVES